MVYSFQLWKHPNIHYQEAVQRLSRCELFSMLRSLSIETDIHQEIIGAAVFLTFECRSLSQEELVYLAGHSCVTFQAEKVKDLLRPLPVSPSFYLPDELPEVLKYKGKTNPTFMRMMFNTVLSLTPYVHKADPILLLDPLCGRGTGLFCGLLSGANAVGLDLDGRDLKEASDYFSRFLKLNHFKHTYVEKSETVQGKPVPVRVFSFSPSREAFSHGDVRTLSLFQGDTATASSLMRKHPAHVLLADLPYGIQHAPQSGARPESFAALLSRALPSWKKALPPGAALALSFNDLTLKPSLLRSLLIDAGFSPVDFPEFSGLSHPVEQAVHRDLIFATLPIN